MSENEHRPILLIEDDDTEVESTKRKLSAAGVQNEVVAIESAGEAYEFLARRGRHAGSEHKTPGVVLLDLSLPDAYGAEFLEFLKQKGMKIPVVVLTDAETTATATLLKGQGADGIIDKPVSLDGFLRAIKPLPHDWLVMKRVGRSSGMDVEGA